MTADDDHDDGGGGGGGVSIFQFAPHVNDLEIRARTLDPAQT